MPLVFNQHFTGTMDHWDPAVTDGFAKDREVIADPNDVIEVRKFGQLMRTALLYIAATRT